MEKWSGKVAVVTGASEGIGASIVKSLADAGMQVVGLARREHLIRELSTNVTGSGKIYARKCDVSVEAEVLEAFAWVDSNLGGVDVLVNNAGIMLAEFVIMSKTEDYRKLFDVNVVSACVCVREGVRSMRNKSSKGHVVLINSVLGHRIPDVPVPLFGAYPATKFALTGLSQTVRQELHFHRANIKLTSISPGMVDTNLLNVYDKDVYSVLPKLKPDDVASAVMYALGTPDYVQIEEIILQAMCHPSHGDADAVTSSTLRD